MSRTRRHTQVRSGCPTPDKTAYRSWLKAKLRADQLGLYVQRQCTCQLWHLTSKKPTGKQAQI